MKVIQRYILMIIVCFFITAQPNVSFAEAMSVEMGTTFSCTSNDECKRKCEAIGGRWKRDASGSTYGTCTLPPSSLSELVNFSAAALRDEKKIKMWTQVGDEGPDDVIFLTPRECDTLGGDVDYHSGCSGTHLKCTTTDSDGKRRSVCIDEMDRFID